MFQWIFLSLGCLLFLPQITQYSPACISITLPCTIAKSSSNTVVKLWDKSNSYGTCHIENEIYAYPTVLFDKYRKLIEISAYTHRIRTLEDDISHRVWIPEPIDYILRVSLLRNQYIRAAELSRRSIGLSRNSESYWIRFF